MNGISTPYAAAPLPGRCAPPRLLLLPGLDGIGKRLARLTSVLSPAAAVELVRYPAQEPLGYEQLEAQLRARLPPTPFVLLAESFSGPLAIRVAAAPPPSLRGLILASSFARFPLPCPRWAIPLAARLPVKSLPRWLRAPLLSGSLDPRTAPRTEERSMAAVSAAVIRHRIAELLRVDERGRLRTVQVPVLILSARADRVLSRRAARALKAHCPHAELLELEGPHALLQHRPERCAEAVLQFMERWI